MIQSMRPSRSANTWPAVVGDGRPERLALGPATGVAAALINARAIGWAGMRTATVDRPPNVTEGTDAAADRTIVNGPGQYASANPRAAGVTSAATRSNQVGSGRWMINGLSGGRILA
jgi:hypothetical protein